jgi:prolipoprotein diacylglyceryltransferase
LAKVSIAVPAELIGNEQGYYDGFESRNKENYKNADDHFFTVSSTAEIVSNQSGTSIVSTIGIIPRIPTQLIESGSYFLIFILLFIGYWKWHWYKRQGLLFGMFFVLLFSARFVIEFWKEHQTLDGNASLNMGQWLSVPAIAIGLFFIAKAVMKKPIENYKTESE